MRLNRLIVLILIVLAGCEETVPPVVTWNIRADCNALPPGLQLINDMSAVGWCTVSGEILALGLAPGDMEIDGIVRIPDPPSEPEAITVPDTFTTLTDPYGNAWNLERIKAKEARAISMGDGVKVLIVDTGITRHQDLPAPVDCYSTVGGVGCEDGHGHGTHVAGIVAMILGNPYGGIGVAPGVQIGACKALDDSGTGSISGIARCIIDSPNKGYDVVNLSLGAQASSNLLNDAIEYAVARDVVLVAACGNNGQSPVGGLCMNPAAHDLVISVAASDTDDRIPAWVNGGADLAAPGYDILSTVRNNGYFKWSGTSMASPHVAGAIATYLSHFAGKSPSDAKNALLASSRDVPCPSNRCGAGILDQWALLNEVVNPTPTPLPPLEPTSTFTPYPSPTFTTTPTATVTQTPEAETCGISVARVAGLEDLDRWWHISGSAYLNWLADDETFWSFLPIDIGDGFMHISIAAEDAAVCAAFRTLFEVAGYDVYGD